MAVLPEDPRSDGNEEASPSLDEHPVVVAVSSLLAESLQGKSGRNWRTAPDDFADATYGTITSQLLEPGPESQERKEELEECLEEEGDNLAKPLRPKVKALWRALLESSHEETAIDGVLNVEDMEELVLAHLHVFPEHLGRSLIGRLVQQLALGQTLAEGDGRLRAGDLLQALSSHLQQLLPIARQVSMVACEHMSSKSALLATKMMAILDKDRDGLVREVDFLEKALDALNLEVENVAVSAAVPALLNNSEFADIFHPAMASCLGISGAAA